MFALLLILRVGIEPLASRIVAYSFIIPVFSPITSGIVLWTETHARTVELENRASPLLLGGPGSVRGSAQRRKLLGFMAD